LTDQGKTSSKDQRLDDVEDLILRRRQVEPRVVRVLLGSDEDVERNGRHHRVQRNLVNGASLHDDPKVRQDLLHALSDLLLFLQEVVSWHRREVDRSDNPRELWDRHPEIEVGGGALLVAPRIGIFLVQVVPGSNDFVGGALDGCVRLVPRAVHPGKKLMKVRTRGTDHISKTN